MTKEEKKEVIEDFETAKAAAIKAGKTYIIRDNLNYYMYADGYQTQAGSVLKKYVLEQNYKWIPAIKHDEAYKDLHGSKGIIAW